MKKTIKSILAVLLCLLVVGSVTAVAVTPSYAPYLGYEYNSFDESIAAPIGYLPAGTIKGSDLEYSINAKAYTDVAVDDHSIKPEENSFYVLDGKAGAVYKTDINLNIKDVYNSFTDMNGKPVNLKGATQIACDYSNSYFYVYKKNANNKKGKIYVIDALSRVQNIINTADVIAMNVTSYRDGDYQEGQQDTFLCTITANKRDRINIFDHEGNLLDNLYVSAQNENGEHFYSPAKYFEAKGYNFSLMTNDIGRSQLYVAENNTESMLKIGISKIEEGWLFDYKFDEMGFCDLSLSNFYDGKEYMSVKNITSVTLNEMGDILFVALKNGTICMIDTLAGSMGANDMGESYIISRDVADIQIPENISMHFTSLAYNSEKRALVCFDKAAGTSTALFNIPRLNTVDKPGFKEEITEFPITLKNPSDMAYIKGENKDFVYILDSGNSRILKLNKEMTKVEKIFANFYHENEGVKDKTSSGFLSFYGAQGLAIDSKERIYIADTAHDRVICAYNTGVVYEVITRPDQQLQDTKSPFTATKVMIDRKDQIYVICSTINLGSLVFTQDEAGNCEFKSFFASNTVTQTADVILNFIRKQFLTREQMKAIRKSTPITLANFDLDDNGFAYTVTEVDKTSTNSNFTEMVRKLNYQGDNIFSLNGNSKGFGDFEWDRSNDTITNTSFVDVDVDSKGYINLIDSGRNKIFQYTEDGNLVTVFGGSSTLNNAQYGRLVNPSAIESIGENIYVLDADLHNISIFAPTDYTKKLRTAYDLLDSSDADAALAAWEEVLTYNTNSQYPYYGMGRAYEMKEDYENAMKYYKLAYAKNEYSKAFQEYRKDWISDNIALIAGVIILALAIVIIAVKLIKKRMVSAHGEAYSPLETKRGLPIYVLLHPVDGFEQFRTRKIYSIPIALGLVVAYFLVKVFEFFATGFAFNNNRPIDYDLFAQVISTIGLYVLFVVSNWAICTLLNGKGGMKEIMCVTGYALTPLMLTTLIGVAMSNVMTLDEGAFISIVVFLGMLWSVIILLMGMYTIHQYSFIGTVGSVLLTVLGMAVMGLLIVLFFTLLNQFYSFIVSVISEIKLR